MSNEAAYFDALKRIASYQSPERLRRGAEKQYGLTPEEAIEMAYENVIEEAKRAVKGKRRPAPKDTPTAGDGEVRS
ncbi:hypothetical protein HBF26_17055 [Luteibacter jiangsuensis]|uniref:Uncharacterized protein n=1 Tax=Luteibacter jiangsuensis TaxID=637577 RepID=A0ABX0Q8E4_9GAMM|nr:hypothetical protein [Luteibacter jiangsuensis]NID06607.1 hypothetical protein [Luteibacter jiangsuensis]